METSITELNEKIERIEKVEPEEWEISAINERKNDEFLEWKSIENEL